MSMTEDHDEGLGAPLSSPWKKGLGDEDSGFIGAHFRAFPIRHGADKSLPEYAMFEIDMARDGNRVGAAHIELTLEQLDQAIIDLLGIRRWIKYGRVGEVERREAMKAWMLRRRSPGTKL